MLIADEAKAIVDSLDQLRYAGGIAEVAKALRAGLEVVDVPTLVEYANRMGNKSLGSRLGYLLESLSHPAEGQRPEPRPEPYGELVEPPVEGHRPELVEGLVEGLIRSASPIKLDPTRPRNDHINTRWQIVVNVPQAELFPQGVG